MVGQKSGCPLHHFLGGLADEDQRSAPLAFALRQLTRRAQQHRHVQVVAAGVHDAHLLALNIGGLDGAGVVQAGLLLDREGIHVSANQETRPNAVFEHRNDTEGLGAVLVFAHALGDGVAQLAQIGRHEGRGLLLVAREFGVAVQMLIGFDESRQLPLDRGAKVSGGGGVLRNQGQGGEGNRGNGKRTQEHEGVLRRWAAGRRNGGKRLSWASLPHKGRRPCAPAAAAPDGTLRHQGEVNGGNEDRVSAAHGDHGGDGFTGFLGAVD